MHPICPSLCPVCLSFCPSMNSFRPPVHPTVYTPSCPALNHICPPICLSVCQSIHPPVHLCASPAHPCASAVGPSVHPLALFAGVSICLFLPLSIPALLWPSLCPFLSPACLSHAFHLSILVLCPFVCLLPLSPHLLPHPALSPSLTHSAPATLAPRFGRLRTYALAVLSAWTMLPEGSTWPSLTSFVLA